MLCLFGGSDLPHEASFLWATNDGTGISEFCISWSVENPTKTRGSHIPYQENTRLLHFLSTGAVSWYGAKLWSFAHTVHVSFCCLNWCVWRIICLAHGFGRWDARLRTVFALRGRFWPRWRSIPTTSWLREHLLSDALLRFLCGWSKKCDVPSAPTFFWAFEEFAAAKLPTRIHEALINHGYAREVVGHISRNSTAIEARIGQSRRVKGQPC